MSMPVEIRFDGEAYAGSFDVDARPRRRLLTVSTDKYGSRTTELGDTPPRLLAEMILRHLVEKELAERNRSACELIEA